MKTDLYLLQNEAMREDIISWLHILIVVFMAVHEFYGFWFWFFLVCTILQSSYAFSKEIKFRMARLEADEK